MLSDLISIGCSPSIFVAVISWILISSEELQDEGGWGCFYLPATLTTSITPLGLSRNLCNIKACFSGGISLKTYSHIIAQCTITSPGNLSVLSSSHSQAANVWYVYTNQQLIREWKYLLKLKAVRITILIFHLEQMSIQPSQDIITVYWRKGRKTTVRIRYPNPLTETFLHYEV